MISTVKFENEAGDILRPYEDYGIILVSFDAPAPTPKVNRISIDGMDGTLDMTEWAGEVRYNDRNVTISLRDMNQTLPNPIINFCDGQKLKITHSDEPNFYYYGRCEVVTETTRKHVTDTQMGFVCEPYKLKTTETILNSVGKSSSIFLQAMRKSVVPTIYVGGSPVITYDGVTYHLEDGEHVIPQFVITQTRKQATISGGTDSFVKFTWRDGVL